MGRRTWESLAARCPDARTSSSPAAPATRRPAPRSRRSLDAALALVRLPAPAFCIGGAEFYAAALPRADEMHVTEIAGSPVGDTSFPAWDRSDWVETERRPGAGTDTGAPECHFVTYRRAR